MTHGQHLYAPPLVPLVLRSMAPLEAQIFILADLQETKVAVSTYKILHIKTHTVYHSFI